MRLQTNPGDRCRLAGAAALVVWQKPVPASLHIAGAVLAGIDDHEAVAVGEVVHQRCRGERGRILRAAVKHADQRCWHRGI
jgi:hypothetical protein